MKISKKITAAALAAMMTGTCITAAASAETQEKKLYVSPVEATLSFSGNIFSLKDGTLAYISDSQLENWKNTGEFAFNLVNTDFNISENPIMGYNFKNNKGWVVQKIDGKSNLRLVSFDESTCTLHETKNLQNDWYSAQGNGVFAAKKNTSSYSFTFYSIDGTEKSFDLNYTTSDNDMWFGYDMSEDSKYDLAIIWLSGQGKYKNDSELTLMKYAIYGLTKDGNVETIYESGDDFDIGNFGSISLGKNCVSWLEQRIPVMGKTITKIYETGEELVIDPWSIDGLTCKTASGESTATSFSVIDVFGNKMITRYESDVTGEEEYRYVLLDKDKLDAASPIDKCKPDSKSYKYMYSNDGKIFKVQSEDDKWGYIDANGNELGFFDDAGTFAGDYAPVVKDGKAYLIDRNMNCVSEKIDADSIGTYSTDTEHFMITKDDKNYIVAISDAAKAPNEPETSETPDTPDTSSTTESADTSSATESADTSSTTESADSSSAAADKADGENPATGAAGFALLSVIAAASVAIVSRKKK